MGGFYNYNTYSCYSIKKWIGSKVRNIKFVKFNPKIDLNFNRKGIGTYTIKTKDRIRLQFSAGMLLN